MKWQNACLKILCRTVRLGFQTGILVVWELGKTKYKKA